MKYLKYAALCLLVQLAFSLQSFAQCAMCRASVESTISDGNVNFAARLNFGILYLFVMPYLLVGLVGYFWYRKSHQNAKGQAIAKIRKDRVAHLDH